jgi:hypothetical protein
MAVTVYSFKDLTGVFTHPWFGSFNIGAQNELSGLGQITIHMATDNTIHDIAIDGSIIVWPVAVFNGSVQIQCQQTSSVHQFFTGWYNTLVTNMTLVQNTNVSTWASGTLALRNIHNGSGHNITGISPQIFPDKTYAIQGQNVTWNLLAANIANY